MDELAAVLAELAPLTGLNLRLGARAHGPLRLADIPVRQIHVRSAVGASQKWPASPPGCADSGMAATRTGTRYYAAGLVAIGASALAGGQMPDEVLTVLRHHLGHVLGLGHAARSDQVMNYAIPATGTGYGRGDRYGLRVLGEPAPAVIQMPLHAARERRPLCEI